MDTNSTIFDLKTPDPLQTFSDTRLEQFILFAVAVAGKTAKTIEKQLDVFLSFEPTHNSPFDKVLSMISKGALRKNLRRAKLGQYDKLTKSYRQLVNATDLNLRTCSVEELETFHGIGCKTSRFFVLHTRPDQRLAVLDTHILKFLSKVYVDEKVPKFTPTGKKYKYWEEKFLHCADNLKMTPAALDTWLWEFYSKS